MQTLQCFDVAVAGCVVLADVIAAFDEIVLPRAFRLSCKQTNLAVVVADRADALFCTAVEAAVNAFKPAVFFCNQVHERRTLDPAEIRQLIEIDRVELRSFQLFRFRK